MSERAAKLRVINYMAHSINGNRRFADVRSAYDVAFARLAYEIRTVQSAATGVDQDVCQTIAASGRIRAAQREYRERRDDLVDLLIREYHPRIEFSRGTASDQRSHPDRVARYSLVK